MDNAWRGVPIEADVVERAAAKLPQNRAVCSNRNTADPPDELDAIAIPEVVGWLHTP